MVQPKPVSLTQVDEASYEGAFEPEPLLIVGPVPGGGGGGGGSTAWSDITGKPTTFTPSAHTQAISTITGLDSALAGKASTVDLDNTFGIATEAHTIADEALGKASTAVQPAAIANFVPNTRTVAGKPLSANVALDKIDVGLSNVDNTSDVNKPISTAQQTALDGKVPISRSVAGKALTADVTLVKGDVGLGNVDNTSDANKPVSTAQATAIGLKVNTADVAGLNTVGWGRTVFIPKNGTVPGGTPTYTIVIEAEA